MANIVISHGDKGGVGKSVVAAATIDYCLANGIPVALIEGDKSQPDVAQRYLDHIAVDGVNLNRADAQEQAGIQFVDAVNDITTNHDDMVVVVNLPATASDTLDGIADELMASANASGHQCSVIYSLGQHSHATAGIRRSAESGLIGAVDANNVTIAYNAYLGDPEKWHYKISGTRGEIGSQFNEITIPELRPLELAQKVFATERPLSDLVKAECGDLTITERIFFNKRWLEPTHEAIASALPLESDA